MPSLPALVPPLPFRQAFLPTAYAVGRLGGREDSWLLTYSATTRS
jgi:hypothetical protein